MNNSWKNGISDLALGTSITGKWSGGTYKLINILGYGVTGVVYLASSNNKLVALKISTDSSAIASEVNILKQFQQVPGHSLGPSFIDVDDLHYYGTMYHFYVMEYIKGESLSEFVLHHGDDFIIVFIIQLLKNLEILHNQGFVFGDLKPDNLIVQSDYQLRLLDVGGVTLKGRGIKEFTEFFDRGYWGVGSRKAEPSYDIFSVLMIMIQLVYKKQFKKGKVQLKKVIEEHSYLQQYKSALIPILENKYTSATILKNKLLKIEHTKKQKDIIQYDWLDVTLVFMVITLVIVIFAAKGV